MAYVVPKSDQKAYRQMIQRANRRVQSNIKYVRDNGISDNYVRTMLTGDFMNKRRWANTKSPFSSRTQFESEHEYQQYLRFVSRWGEDTGRRGGHKADPRAMEESYRDSITLAINGLIRNRGISLEEWNGDIPPELKAELKGLSLEQMTHFFRSVDPDGQVDLYDSDQVGYEDVDDFIAYIFGIIGELKKFYPVAEKKVTKKGKKRKSRRKTKGRK